MKVIAVDVTGLCYCNWHASNANVYSCNLCGDNYLLRYLNFAVRTHVT